MPNWYIKYAKWHKNSLQLPHKDMQPKLQFRTNKWARKQGLSFAFLCWILASLVPYFHDFQQTFMKLNIRHERLIYWGGIMFIWKIRTNCWHCVTSLLISWHLLVGGSRDSPLLSRPLKFSLERLSVSILLNGSKYTSRWTVARKNCGIKMSRAHMLYDNKPLESIPVTPVRWEKRWEPEMLFRSQRLVQVF